MTAYTTISNPAVAVGGIPSSTTVSALRDNPTAIAEASSGAPVIASAWHPVDKVTVGDGKDGLIYDSAVNGVVANVVTPDFADGWEYRIIGTDLGISGSTTVRLGVYGYFQSSGAYFRLAYSNDDSSTRYGCDVEICMPRLTQRGHIVKAGFYAGTVLTWAQDTTAYNTSAQKILKAKVEFSSGSIITGKIYLLRRREFITSP